MERRDFEQLKMIIIEYIQLLEREYSAISKILSINMDFFSDWEQMKVWYGQRLEQINELVYRNRKFLEVVKVMESEFYCVSAALNSLETIDDDDTSTIAAVRETTSDIAVTIPEKSLNEPHLTNRKKSALSRKLPADVLKTEETVTVSSDDQIVDDSTVNAIATLGSRLTGGDEALVNVDGTISNPSDSFSQCNSDNGSKSIDMDAVAGDGMTNIQVSPGKLVGEYVMCKNCGKVFSQTTNYCPECGMKVVNEKPIVTLDKVQFSALAPKTFVKGDYSVIEIFMYEEAYRNVVQEAIANADDPVKETKSGILSAERDAKITVMLSSPDFFVEDNTESQTWQGDYLSFRFAIEVPEQYKKRQILFVASVYFNDIIATRLKFVAKCKTSTEQKIEVIREDVLSAFVSYASQDRNRVAMIIQGMKKARPDMDIFFDVDNLRSGDDWEKELWLEIDKRDVLFLCWSKYARDSKWVDAEWRYAFENKGADSIEPVPIDPPSICPPPDELKCKYFNDKLLYIINSNPTVEGG